MVRPHAFNLVVVRRERGEENGSSGGDLVVWQTEKGGKKATGTGFFSPFYLSMVGADISIRTHRCLPNMFL